MTQPPTLYEILGVDPEAKPDDIKRAYRKRATQKHPDTAKDKAKAHDEFVMLNKAYRVLSNPADREHYDRTGTVNEDAGTRLHELAKQTLNGLAIGIVEQCDDDTDLIAALHRTISSTIEGSRAKAAEIRKRQAARSKKFAAFAKRIKRGSRKGDNLLALVLENEAKKMEAEASTHDGNVKLGEEMLRVLSDYEFIPDSAPVPGSFADLIRSHKYQDALYKDAEEQLYEPPPRRRRRPL